MTPAPLVSVVLPSYNGARYLREAADSVLRQTWENWELILVDDASTDDTAAIAAEYVKRDPRIRTLRNPTNRKLPGSLNRGFEEAKGELLTWTSDDNRYRPDALAAMAGYLEQRPEVDVVYSGYTTIDEAGAETGPGRAAPLEELPFRNVVGACFLYRRHVHAALGGYAEDLFLVEDYDFWLRASAQFRIARLERDLYLYRYHDASLTSRREAEIRRAKERCLRENLPRMSWMGPELGTRAWCNLISMPLERGDRKAAAGYLRAALRTAPLPLLRKDPVLAAELLLPACCAGLLRTPEARRWERSVRLAARELTSLIPPDCPFILVDEDRCAGSELTRDRQSIPFLEQDGKYWGAPPDDETAVRELERLRRGGAAFLVITWPAFWWLDCYRDFSRYLHTHFSCVTRNARIVVFDLRSGDAHG